MERLDKRLASTGRWSRREIKDLVRQGRVWAAGRPVARPEEKWDPAEVELQVVDGEGAVHPVALSCQEDGTIYTGELELPLLTGRSFAASAVFRAGGMAYTRPLLDVTVSQSGWSGEVLWTEKPGPPWAPRGATGG